jgi:NAD-dependent dihydropyrimidine dehydrogenase PreA subunit
VANLIVIQEERCTGCGACVEVCPEGAIYLVEDKANVDRALCRECEACIAACPMEAITVAVPARSYAVESVRVPVPRAEPKVIQVQSPSAPVPLRGKVLPLVGAALAWAGREIVPYLAEHLLQSLDRRSAAKTRPAEALPRSQGRSIGGRGRGGGRRRRRRRDG